MHKSSGADIIVLMHKRNNMRHTWYHVATEGAGDQFLKRFKEIEEYWKRFITAYEGR